MGAFLRLVRYQNLLIIVFSMLMMFFCVIEPILQLFNLPSTLTWLDVTFLVLACVCIAAGGYAVNDYYDTVTDSVNRPDAVLVSRKINRSTAVNCHIFLSVLGCIFGFLVSVKIGIWKVGFLFPIIVGLLWYYSTAYKKMFFVGNFVVAVLTGTIVILPALYEIPGLLNCPSEVVQYDVFDPYLLLYQSLVVGLFAFMTNLVREIIKDVEDIDGDKTLEAKTMAIVLGQKKTKIVVAFLLLLTVAGLVFLMLNYLPEPKTYVYISVAVIAPMIFCTYKVLRAEEKKDFHFCSTLMKIIMLTGISYLFIMRYNFLHFRDEF
jgi:4-hydroxybenzoate polyprenyltransferase